MTLKVYRQKRDFKKTPEPAGKVNINKKYKNIYIIQKHAASHLHYDFRLELNGVLLSWAVPKGPCLDPKVKRLAMHVEDHPVEYAFFEGIIPQGEYGGGTVMLWDKGTWQCKDKNPSQSYHAGNLTFELDAEKLHGLWKLVRIKTAEKAWLLIKIADQYARPLSEFDITKAEPYSVSTGQDLDEIAANYSHLWGKKGLEKRKKPSKAAQSKPQPRKKKVNLDLPTSSMPKVIHPQLATLVDQPPEGKEWLHEIKFDGYRLIAFKEGKNVKLMTRNNNNWTEQFQSIANAIKLLPAQNIILDGEVVVLDDEQHSNFQLLQNAIKGGSKPFLYYVFDLLYFDKYNLMSLPLLQRKQLLQEFFKSITDTHLKYSDHVFGSGKKILAKSCKLGLEGIVSKDSQCKYLQKRSSAWLKTKCLKRQEFVIGGFTHPQGSRQYFGSLLLGTYNKKGELQYNGNVGTGFTQASLKSVYQNLKKYITNHMPFDEKPPGSSKVIWLQPKLIAEVEFSEWTKDNSVRHPSFKGLRTDKPAIEIKKEKETPVKKIVKQRKNKKS